MARTTVYKKSRKVEYTFASCKPSAVCTNAGHTSSSSSAASFISLAYASSSAIFEATSKHLAVRRSCFSGISRGAHAHDTQRT